MYSKWWNFNIPVNCWLLTNFLSLFYLDCVWLNCHNQNYIQWFIWHLYIKHKLALSNYKSWLIISVISRVNSWWNNYYKIPRICYFEICSSKVILPKRINKFSPTLAWHVNETVEGTIRWPRVEALKGQPVVSIIFY